MILFPEDPAVKGLFIFSILFALEKALDVTAVVFKPDLPISPEFLHLVKDIDIR